MLSKILGATAAILTLFWPLALLVWWPVNVVFSVYIGVAGTTILAGAAVNLLFWKE